MVRFFVKCGPSSGESTKVCRGEWYWLECAKEVLFMKWSTWSAKGDKRDDVDALSYTLTSGKGSSCAQKYFLVETVGKELNNNLWWDFL